MAARADGVARVTKLENKRPVHGKRGNGLLAITGFPIPFRRFSVAPISLLPRADGDATFTREHQFVAPESRKNLPDDGQVCEADRRVFRHKSGAIAWPAIRVSHTMRTGLAAVPPARKVGHTRVGTSRSSDPEEIGGIAAGDPSTRPAHHALAIPACPVTRARGPILRRVSRSRSDTAASWTSSHLTRSSQRSPDVAPKVAFWRPKVRCLKMKFSE